MAPKSTLIELLGKARRNRTKLFSLLIDPDKTNGLTLDDTLRYAENAGVDLYLIGGSLITNGLFEETVTHIKGLTNKPVCLFPGNTLQISANADGILLLSLISGRNPELLIGKHVLAAPLIKKAGLEVIPTGYMLIDGGNTTSVAYMSGTLPIPADKHSIAVCTALAGEQLGLRCIYMDAGSGAKYPISPEMIKKVRAVVDVPLIIGGGIRDPETAVSLCEAGADMIVVGNAAEKSPEKIAAISNAVHNLNLTSRNLPL